MNPNDLLNKSFKVPVIPPELLKDNPPIKAIRANYRKRKAIKKRNFGK